MQREVLQQLLEQSKSDCSRILDRINEENIKYRLTRKTASAGFIYRHIGETTHVISTFLGCPTDVKATTLGQNDTGLDYDLETSNRLFQTGYATLEKQVVGTSEQQWLEEIDTPFFGRLSRIRLFTIILLHNAQHCGQIASALAKGSVH